MVRRGTPNRAYIRIAKIAIVLPAPEDLVSDFRYPGTGGATRNAEYSRIFFPGHCASQ